MYERGEGVGEEGSPQGESSGGSGGCLLSALSVHTSSSSRICGSSSRRKCGPVAHHTNVHHASHGLVPRTYTIIVQCRHALHTVRLVIESLADLAKLGRSGARDDDEDGLDFGAYQRKVGCEEPRRLRLEKIRIELGEGGHYRIHNLRCRVREHLHRRSPLTTISITSIIIVHRKFPQHENLKRMQDHIVLQYAYNLRQHQLRCIRHRGGVNGTGCHVRQSKSLKEFVKKSGL
mmetsp:Transcript_9416/g.19853  ORF Transcript_9416/g.19853 Transcript_9416/m.19853 type:complete len:233 (+) Transcript_9416:1315-2013(+)